MTPDRRLPRRRPSRGHVRHRAGHGRPRPQDRHRPGRAAGPEHHQDGAVPLRGGHRAHLRLRRPRGRAGPAQGARRLRRAPRRADPASGGGRHQAPRHRHLVLLRDVRPRPEPGAGLAQLLGGRLGVGDGARAADEQGAGRVGRDAARPGPRDVVGDDRGRPPRRRSRRRRRAPLRHRAEPAGHGHLRLALARRRRDRDHDGVRPGARQGPSHRRPPARGQRRRPRVPGRRVLGAGLARQGDAARRGGVRGVHRPRPARRRGAEPRGPGHLRPAELLVAVRDPHLRGRGRRGDRQRRPPAVRGRRRLRQPDQPAHRRGPDPRRHRPGHRPGAVRGGRLRRRRQPADLDARRLPGAVGGRRPEDGPRPDRHAEPDQPARREGHRRGRHDRRRTRGHQRRRRRADPARRHRRADAGLAGQRVDGDPGGSVGRPVEGDTSGAAAARVRERHPMANRRGVAPRRSRTGNQGGGS